jgi:hypothetical protein
VELPQASTVTPITASEIAAGNGEIVICWHVFHAYGGGAAAPCADQFSTASLRTLAVICGRPYTDAHALHRLHSMVPMRRSRSTRKSAVLNIHSTHARKAKTGYTNPQ